jgi:hypothetical protein
VVGEAHVKFCTGKIYLGELHPICLLQRSHLRRGKASC